MNTTPEGRRLIEAREGVRLKAYRDSAGIWTIGVGHTSAAGPPAVVPGLGITPTQASDILSQDLAQFERAVAQAVTVPLAAHEFDALISLAFNIGAGAFARSTLVRRLNAGDRAGAAEAFLMWANAGGKPLLLRRRKAERRQFLGR